MMRKPLTLLILICLISILEVGNVSAFSDDEKKKPHPENASPNKEDNRVIIETKIEIVFDENCYCGGDPPSAFSDSDSSLTKLKKTMFKPFKFVGKFFKTKS